MSLIKPFSGAGSTPSRRRFWDEVTQAVNASRKIAGRHVTVSEHEGKGTLINVADTSARRAVGPVVICPDGVILSFSGVIFDCGCTFGSEAETTSLIVTEGTVNSDTVTMTKGVEANCLAMPCVWHTESFTMTTDLALFPDSSDCSTTESDTTSNVFGILVFDGSLYHLFFYSVTGLSAFFYGTTDDLTVPIDNTLSCSGSFIEFDNPAITCLFGAPTSLTVVGHDGIASFVLLP